MKFPRIIGTPKFLIFLQAGEIIIILSDAGEHRVRKSREVLRSLL